MKAHVSVRKQTQGNEGAVVPSPARETASPTVVAAVKQSRRPRTRTTTAARPVQSALRFEVNVSDTGYLTGWVANTDQPDTRYEIQAWSGVTLVGYDQAERTVATDVSHDNGISAKGFEIHLSRLVRNGRMHRIRIEACPKGGDSPTVILQEALPFQTAPEIHVDPRLVLLASPQENRQLAIDMMSDSPDERVQTLIEKVLPKLSLHLHNLDFPEVKTLLDVCVKLSAEHPFFIYKAAELVVLKNGNSKALPLLTHFLKVRPGCIKAWLLKAHCHVQLNELDAARQCLQSAQLADPSNKLLCGRQVWLESLTHINAPRKDPHAAMALWTEWTGRLSQIPGWFEDKALLTALVDFRCALDFAKNGDESAMSHEVSALTALVELKKARLTLELIAGCSDMGAKP